MVGDEFLPFKSLVTIELTKLNLLLTAESIQGIIFSKSDRLRASIWTFEPLTRCLLVIKVKFGSDKCR